MLRALFDTLLKATDPRPRYTGSRCLVEKDVAGGCNNCAVVCPHDAVRITDRIEVIEDSCTGCGLCVQVCPTAALEYDLMPMLGTLMDQGVRANDATVPVQAVLTCSKVPGDLADNAAQVSCLGKISPAMILASQAWGQALRLVHSDCANCQLGGPTVPESLENVLEIVRAYRKNIGNEPLNISIFQHQSEEVRRSPLVTPPITKSVSRRQAFSKMFQTGKRNVAQVIPENPIPGVVTTLEAAQIPEEWKWRRIALKPRPGDDAPQYWPVPTVNDQCTFCHVCESICPSQAVTRTRDGLGNYAINLEVAACTGCDACVKSCPPQAMNLEPEIFFAQLNEMIHLHQGNALED